MGPKTRSDFEKHWSEQTTLDISLAKQAEARAFLRPLYERMTQSNDPMRILDVGCGDGVHAVVLTKEGLGGHRYYGIDLSSEAVKLAKRRVSELDWTGAEFQIGDALSLPYCSQSFHVVFSYGVVAYTDAPEVVLNEMVRVCKCGGLIGIWLYPKMDGLAGTLLESTRAVCRCLGRRLSKIIVYMIVPLLPLLPVRSGINIFNSTWKQCVEVVEVNLLPEVLEFHTLENVLHWFQKRQLEIQLVDPDRPIAVWARVSK
jgi:ubiquinone/menaquinone biosynthesis C-methylase UbiE